jgi:hypothetical protein
MDRNSPFQANKRSSYPWRFTSLLRMRLSTERFPPRPVALTLSWGAERIQGAQHVRIRWREHGLTISRAPLKRGFGSEILEKSIPEMLQGSFNRTFHHDGVECVFEFSIQG